MEPSKRSNDCSIDDNKRQKLEGKRVTHFEDLSNEILYEIFELLDFCYICTAFFNLNQRFESLLLNYTIPIHIDVSSISKANFQQYYKYVGILYLLQTRSIRLINLFVYDHDFSPLRIITVLSHLEKLIVHNIESDYLEKLLYYLRFLPKVHSLDIEPIDQIRNPIDIYSQIFLLSKLKYCKISFNTKSDAALLPLSVTKYSPIEHLIIKNSIRFDQLERLLSYVPQLYRLTCLDICQLKHEQKPIRPIVLNKLIHVSLQMRHTAFIQFKKWIKHLLHKIEDLRISTQHDIHYLDANEWEELIRDYLPNLRIFDIQHIYAVHKDKKQLIDIIEKISQFNSPFWCNHQWSFEHLHGWKNNWDNRILYSNNPYKRKNFILFGEMTQEIYPLDKKIHLNTVQHVYIRSLQAITNCTYYFPNATKVTFECVSELLSESIGANLNRIMVLKKLNKLVINCRCFSIEQIIELLCSTPNLRILILESIHAHPTNHLSIQQSENFRMVSNTNIITNLTIEEPCTLNETELIVTLCPQLEHLTIRIATQFFKSTLRFLLSKNNNHLFSLCINNAFGHSVKSLKTFIQSEKLLADYSLKFFEKKLYIWW